MRGVGSNLGLLLGLGWGLIGCGAPSPMTPTPFILFSTPTPSATEVALLPSPMPTVTPAAPVPPPPTDTPASTLTPTATPLPAATSTASSTPTLTPTVTPHAVINSPNDLLNVRGGPGLIYDLLGAYNNGAAVEVIGKQYSAEGTLWWLIPFAASPSRQGWIYAGYTTAYNVEQVPWIVPPPAPTLPPPPPTPTPTATTPATPPNTPTPPPTPSSFLWTVTGRVIRVGTGQSIAGASISARLGQAGTSLTTTTDGYGQFTILAYAADEGDLLLTITAPGHAPQKIAAGPATPRTYNFPAIELVRQESSSVTWTISGRVTERGDGRPIAVARVEASLGVEAVRLETITDAGGAFWLTGQARDEGALSLHLTAAGYQPNFLSLDEWGLRVYDLPHLQLVPLAD